MRWICGDMNDNLKTIFDGVLQAGYSLLKLGGAYLLYLWGRNLGQHFKPKLKCVAVILVIAALCGFLSYSDLGSHVEDADPLFGGGETVQDYQPTNAERIESGVKNFALFTVLLLLGAFIAFQETDEQAKTERSETENERKRRESD